jgi:hypothetical protein
VELPPALRLVSTIPRERLLTVARTGDGRLTISGRSLRCDGSYCAESWLGELAATPGVRSSQTTPGGASRPQLTIEYDRQAITEQQVIAAVVVLLEASPDPVYTQAIDVRYAD